jgi:NAD(P)-dependent dehydrogenase (short-subunit alcohol dehydrogenase family)
VVGDLADPAQTRSVAEQANQLGRFDAVIHNAGVYRGPEVMVVNVTAPYLLTALVDRPARLVYLTSGMQDGARPELRRRDWAGDAGRGSYADSKLFVTTLALAVARHWPDLISNAVNPGWVPTRMGGPGAPDDLRLGHLTQEWLATSDDPEVLTSGGYWFHQERHPAPRAAGDSTFQDRLLAELETVTGVGLH